MKQLSTFLSLALAVSLFFAPVAPAQETPDPDAQRGDAYYHFSLAHLYQQLALQFVRQEYVDRAVSEYRLAIEADPDSYYLREELIKLYASINKLDDAVAEANVMLERDPENPATYKLLGKVYTGYAVDRRSGTNQGMLNSAVEHLEKARELDPQDTETLLDLSQLYRVGRSMEKAKEALEALLEIEPDNADALTALAGVYLETGEPNKGVEALERVTQTDGTDRRRLGMLAEAYQDAGRHKDAADTFAKLLDQARSVGTNTLEIRRALAENLTMAGRYDEALEQYESLIEAEPRESSYRLRMSQILRQRRRFSDSWEALEKAQELDPTSLEVKYNTVLLLEAERRYDEAIEGLNQILDDTESLDYSPQERGARIVFLELLGSLQRTQEDYDAARETFAEIAELDPQTRSRVLALDVDTLRAAQRYDDAIEASEAAVAEFPKNRSLIMQRASLLSANGQSEEGAELLESLLKGGPEDLDVYLTLVQIHEKGKQYDRAVAAVEKAEELAETEGQKVGVLFAHASVLERAKRFEESEALFRDLLRKDPKNSSALNYLGYMLADRDVKLDEAHDMIQRALDLEPENGAYLDSLGWVYYRQNKLALAERYLVRSLAEFGQDPVVHTHLGDVYFAMGKKEEAQSHWEKGLERWRESPVADRDPAEISKLIEKLESLGVEVTKAGSKAPSKNK